MLSTLAIQPSTYFFKDQENPTRRSFINRSLYPDVSVTCGSIERAVKDTKAIVNPVLPQATTKEETIDGTRQIYFELARELTITIDSF
jgi:hypothetical protein